VRMLGNYLVVVIPLIYFSFVTPCYFFGGYTEGPDIDDLVNSG
jgi:hypothetical protein